VTNHRPHQAIADYAKRWGIETLYQFKLRL